MPKFEWTEKQKEALKLIRDPKNREVYLYGGARSAKTFTFLAEMIDRALEAPRSSHCVCRFEQVDCRKAIFDQTLEKVDIKMHDGLLLNKDYGAARKIHGVAQLRFKNGSYIAFLGVNGNANLEKILGTEWSTIFINEASEISSGSYYTLRTRLAENSGLVGKMFLDANPPPKRHWLYKRFHLKQNLETGQPLKEDMDFAILQMNPVDNRANIPPEYYKQISSMEQPKAKRDRFFLGEYADILDGAVYKRELKQLDKEGREVEITVPKNAPVHVVLDIGQTTAGWIVHVNSLKSRIELVDYIEVYGVGVSLLLETLFKRGHSIKSVVLPHDARALSHQTGTSVEEEYRNLAFKYGYEVSVLPKSKWGDNINALRKWFPKLWFNSMTTGMGMDAVRNYEYPNLTNSLGSVDNIKPKHNWASHGTDALKYVALWCGRFAEPLMEVKVPVGDIRRIKYGIMEKKEKERWKIKNLIKEWTDG
jgi:PBSX family phage terminase large subunit